MSPAVAEREGRSLSWRNMHDCGCCVFVKIRPAAVLVARAGVDPHLRGACGGTRP